VSSEVIGALAAAGVGLVAAPYLARLTVTVPDPDARHWWVGAATTRRVLLATAVVAVVAGALAGAAAGWSALLPAFLVLSLVGTPLIVIDVQVHRLPNRLVFLAGGAEAGLLAVAAAHYDAWSEMLRAAEGAAAVFAALFLLAFISPRSFGLGDVKLGGLLGGYLGWFGWAEVYYGIFAGFLVGAVLSVALLMTRRATMKTAIPFGPMLILGALLVLAFDLVPG
jgi:leader peptidase (prepilin peptidase) / N-methyltransferase